MANSITAKEWINLLSPLPDISNTLQGSDFDRDKEDSRETEREAIKEGMNLMTCVYRRRMETLRKFIEVEVIDIELQNKIDNKIKSLL